MIRAALEHLVQFGTDPQRHQPVLYCAWRGDTRIILAHCSPRPNKDSPHDATSRPYLALASGLALLALAAGCGDRKAGEAEAPGS